MTDSTHNQNGGGAYRFFSHSKCEYFPCHQTTHPEEFNCLFCYCPLYALGKNCGGNYVYTGDGYKDCSGCMIPHRREGFDYVIGKYSELAALIRRQDTAKRLDTDSCKRAKKEI